MKNAPRALLIRAAIIIVAYLITHLLGFRLYTCVLCGTMPGQNSNTLATLGIIYVLLYFGTVLVAPVFVIAAGLLKLVEPRSSDLD